MMKRINARNLMIPSTIRYGEALLQRLYPSMDEDEILQLLEETWSRSYTFEDYTHFRESPYAGKYVNVDSNGFRRSKNQAPWPPDREKYFVIFIFGGSTAFGYGVPDDQTIASHLQDFISAGRSKKVAALYNFGRGHYYSTQERILFEQLMAAHSLPDVALFIDGLNEFFYYENEGTAVSKAFKKFLAGDFRQLWFKELRKRSPVMQTFRKVRKIVKEALFERDVSKIKDRHRDYHPAKLMRCIERYIINKRMIEAVSSSFNTKSIFVWQPVPTYQYNLELHPFGKAGFGRHGYSAFGYPMMWEYVQSHPLGENFLWCAQIQKETEEPLYVDLAHYSPMMSKEFARFICDRMVERNLLTSMETDAPSEKSEQILKIDQEST